MTPARQDITKAAVDIADHATQMRNSIIDTADKNMQIAGSRQVRQKNMCVPYTSVEERYVCVDDKKLLMNSDYRDVPGSEQGLHRYKSGGTKHRRQLQGRQLWLQKTP